MATLTFDSRKVAMPIRRPTIDRRLDSLREGLCLGHKGPNWTREKGGYHFAASIESHLYGNPHVHLVLGTTWTADTFDPESFIKRRWHQRCGHCDVKRIYDEGGALRYVLEEVNRDAEVYFRL